MKTTIFLFTLFASISATAQIRTGGDVGDHGISCVIEAQPWIGTIGIKTVFRNAFKKDTYTLKWDRYRWETSLSRQVSVPSLGKSDELDPRLLRYRSTGWELVTSELGEAALRSTSDGVTHVLEAPEHVKMKTANLFLTKIAEMRVTSKLGIRSELTRHYLALTNRDGKVLDRILYWKTNPWIREGEEMQRYGEKEPSRAQILRLIERNLHRCE